MSPKFSLTVAVLAAAVMLTACKGEADTPAAVPPPTDTPAATAAHSFSPAINEADFAELVKTLASDEFEGRGPGSAGEERSLAYLEAQMKRIGLQPGNNGSFFQDVPMVETTVDKNTTMKLQSDGKTRELKFDVDFVAGSRTGETQVKVDASDMIFVGYGVDAPEQNWNDYAGQDWKGKTVVMFVNDPGFHVGDETLFEGRRMTYYGRWIYKFEEAARKGAAAAFIVHDTPGASYDWNVVKNSWSGAQYDLPAKDDPEPRLPVQGWLSQEAAKQLFADAGLDLEASYKAASQRGFKPVPLKAKLSIELNNTIREKNSRNVVGVLPGTERKDEAVLYMAHWDHLGKHEDEAGDNIYNGAIDNATGVAGILEIAEAFVHQNPKPKRSVVFLSVTLEESGLLGSKYYVAHPTFPLAKIAAVLNLDAMSVAGKAKDVTVVGLGNSELEDILKPIAAAQGRTLSSEVIVESGFYFRSDHFNFAKAGVPALYINGGANLIDGGPEGGKRAADVYAKHYHTPNDQYYPDAWKLDGTMQDLEALYGVGKQVADGDTWPNWYQGNPFKAARDKMMQQKAAQ